jgi:hypothetical protein
MEEGLKLACIYSWNCDAAKMLKVSEILCGFAINQDQNSINLVKRVLKRMGPYKDYRFIANKLELKNIFDLEVIRSYWRYWHNRSIISRFKDIPLDLLAKRINDCFVLSGKVIKEKNDNWIIKYRPIIKNRKCLYFGSYSLKKIVKTFTAKAKKGAVISFHFSVGAEILTKKESQQLIKATNEVLEALNAGTL